MLTHLMRRRVGGAAFLIAALIGAEAGAARHALVVGAQSYENAPTLASALADADAVARELTLRRFEVTTLRDPDLETLRRATETFVAKADAGDVMLFYWSGHAVETDGVRVLLPVGAPALTPGVEVRENGLEVESLMRRLRATSARARIAIIDGCRDDPSAAQPIVATPAVSPPTGLSMWQSAPARLGAPGGSGEFVLFSASAGQQAIDRIDHNDTSPYSLFTRELLRVWSDPEIEIRAMAEELQVRVASAASRIGHAQTPSYHDSLVGEVYLSDAAGGRLDGPEREEVALVLTLRDRATVQRGLRARGYDVGRIDGVFGPRTRDALAQWQAARGFAASGYLTGEQFRLLRRAAADAPRRIERPHGYVTIDRWRAPAPAPIAPRGPRTPFYDYGSDRWIDSQGCARDSAGGVLACPTR
jgi:hypothetical protein